MEYIKEYNDIKSFFLDHINHRLNDFNPLYNRFEIVSSKEIDTGYLYYVINDTYENILYEIFYDINRERLAIDYTLFTC